MINELAHSKTKVSVLSQKGPRQGGSFLSEAIASFCHISRSEVVKESKICKSRYALSNEYWIASIGVGTTEHRLFEVWDRERVSKKAKQVHQMMHEINHDIISMDHRRILILGRNVVPADIRRVVLAVRGQALGDTSANIYTAGCTQCTAPNARKHVSNPTRALTHYRRRDPAAKRKSDR